MRRKAYALCAALCCLVYACEDTTDDPHPELAQGAGSSGNADTQTSKSESGGSSGSSSPAAGSGAKATHIDRSALSNVGTDKPLDYSDPRMWLCRPGNDPDECDIN